MRPYSVMPAKGGIQGHKPRPATLGSRFRGNDELA
jgi:hypothetical protein